MLVGTKVGRYTLLGKIANGGMAEVFLARQDGLQGFSKIVVIKKIHPHLAGDQAFIQMFFDEARLAARINHPNVVTILELGEDPSSQTFYIAMEHIDGCNLKRLAHTVAQKKQRIPHAFCARIVADACAGLDFAHEIKGDDRKPLGIVHRDVSPENVIVTYSGQVKVVDFGIAKASAVEGSTRTGQLKGKLAYMPPEQLMGQPLDRRADVWALGVTLYWMCSGRRPFRGQSEGELVQQTLNVEPPPLSELVPGLPQELGRIVGKTLAKDRSARYDGCRSLRQDLERWIAVAGQPASTAALGDYMNEQFPESTDPDRDLIRALLSGEIAHQMTPSQTDFGQTSSSRRRLAQLAGGEQTAAGSPRSLRARWVPATIALGAIAAVTLVGALLLRRPVAPVVSGPARLAVAPVALAQAASAPAPAALPPPPPVPTPQATSHPHHHHVGSRTSSRSPSASSPNPPVSPGRLALRVLPWAAIYLDGERVGTTPCQPLVVAAGHHALRLVNDEIHARRDLSVEVRPGETTLVKAILQ
ncbi:MAG: protein kinase domain-containing protein [Deltaproteobacteria bacterium]